MPGTLSAGRKVARRSATRTAAERRHIPQRKGPTVFLPYNVDVPMERLPQANWFLITVATIVSLVVLLTGPPQRDSRIDRMPEDFEKAIQVLQHLEQDRVTPLALHPRSFHVWQLVTATLVHLDLIHLIGNMIFL